MVIKLATTDHGDGTFTKSYIVTKSIVTKTSKFPKGKTIYTSEFLEVKSEHRKARRKKLLAKSHIEQPKVEKDKRNKKELIVE
jgi:hypothetical protein